MMDPTVIATMHTIIISRLPNMSANRDMIGVATALVSRVAVTSHDASSELTPRMPGKSGSNGTTMVCCNATTVPHNDNTPMTAHVGVRFLERVGKEGGSVMIIPTPQPPAAGSHPHPWFRNTHQHHRSSLAGDDQRRMRRAEIFVRPCSVLRLIR